MGGHLIEILDARMLCDTPNCGHSEAVPMRAVREYVGRQCPLCSAVMVTDETASSVEQQLAMIDLLNAIAGAVSGEEGPKATLSLRTDTAGDLAEVNFRREPDQ